MKWAFSRKVVGLFFDSRAFIPISFESVQRHRHTAMNLLSPDHTIATFVGADASTFLQSQLTNDVAALAVGDWQWQGYCSAKGRL